MAPPLAANSQAANKRGTSYYTSSLLYHNRHTIPARVRMKVPGPGHRCITTAIIRLKVQGLLN